MDIGKIKCKKPWFVPKWAWNRAVDYAYEAARENLKVGKIASFAGDAAMEGLAKIVSGKDPTTVAAVSAALDNGGKVLSKAGSALLDGVVTDEEKEGVGDAIAGTVSSVVPQETVDRWLAGIRGELMFG